MRKVLLPGTLVILALLIAAAIGVQMYLNSLEPRARGRIIQALQERFDADVELKSLNLSLAPVPTVVGQGLTIRHKQWSDPKPLISVTRFTAQTSLRDLVMQTDNVDLVRLEGLQIDVPPRGASAAKTQTEEQKEVGAPEAGRDTTRLRFNIRTLIADGAVLQIEPKLQGKDPLRFDIEKLTMRSVGPGQPMRFDASLQNARPPGLINSNGRFGSWQKDDPRATPVSGAYTLQNADLGIFRGISGILSSAGSYNGVLQHIEVNGTTDTPNFALKRGGKPVHLQISFRSVVNGMDGETMLNPVDAHFLNSEFVCRGGIIKKASDKKKTVDLDAYTKRARMEDILRLVLGDDRPILTGEVDFKSKIVIPPGDQDVLDKLNLNGRFKIVSARFTSAKVEQRLETLSDRARGITKSEEARQLPETIASDFFGRFLLDNGCASFSHLSFQVPGAQVKLGGTYDLRSQQIDMHGLFGMRATLSETQSGIKHWLLKPVDPFFKKDGAGFEVPLDVTGTREHPEVTVRAFHHQFTLK